MSHAIIESSPDLLRLREEKFDLRIVEGRLVVDGIRCVATETKDIREGSLIMDLDVAGDRTDKPGWHVAHWWGEAPRKADGTKMTAVVLQENMSIGSVAFPSVHRLSSKPEIDGATIAQFDDYYHKVTHYSHLIQREAESLEMEQTGS